MWNVPRIISVSDSFGNRFDNFVDKNIDGTIFDINKAFHCGEQYSVEVEVDPSFDPNSYTIIWEFNKHDFNEFNNQTNITITFGMQDISTSSYLRCKIISNKEWHKYKYFDCKVSLCLTILPPID